MKKFGRTMAWMATTLALAAPFAAHAQHESKMAGEFNGSAYMRMADKNGMLSKETVMKMVSDKFDKMKDAKGMISVKQMEQLLKELYLN